MSYPHAGASAAFTLTAEQHDFTAEYSEQGTAANAGAVVQNTALVTSADFTIKKVDKRTYAAANPDGATPLQGAEFTLTQIDEKVALSSGGEVSIKTGGETRTVASNEQGIVSFVDVPGGWYEVKETKTPSGYVIVGNSTFYVKIANGKAVMLEKGTGKPETWSETSTANTASGDSNVLRYEPATTGQNAAPATVTVGNNAGAELPSTGGPGTVGLTALGLFLLAASLALLRRRHQAR
ncbi:MAG: LPXTG cell wall anchor domain-containing protein [Atopobiaceae bacterium]|nr:LPXTG cell wall anchor domain-containing protein [Atopobiaceae bacterium]